MSKTAALVGTAAVSAPSATTTGVATNTGVDVSAGATAGVATNTGVVSVEAGKGKTLSADKNATTADSAMLGDSTWLL